MTSSQDKGAWNNIALRWKFLQRSTTLWRDPRFICEKQNRSSTTITGTPTNPRLTLHWLLCYMRLWSYPEFCSFNLTCTTVRSVSLKYYIMKSSPLRYTPAALFSLRKEVSSSLLQFPTLSVTFTGADSSCLPDRGACMSVFLFTLQLTSTRTAGGPRAVTAHAGVPRVGYKTYVAIRKLKI